MFLLLQTPAIETATNHMPMVEVIFQQQVIIQIPKFAS
jgi:hypothetical protein